MSTNFLLPWLQEPHTTFLMNFFPGKLSNLWVGTGIISLAVKILLRKTTTYLETKPIWSMIMYALEFRKKKYHRMILLAIWCCMLEWIILRKMEKFLAAVAHDDFFNNFFFSKKNMIRYYQQMCRVGKQHLLKKKKEIYLLFTQQVLELCSHLKNVAVKLRKKQLISRHGINLKTWCVRPHFFFLRKTL